METILQKISEENNVCKEFSFDTYSPQEITGSTTGAAEGGKKEKLILIKGCVQSGKTATILGLMFKGMIPTTPKESIKDSGEIEKPTRGGGMISIIILRNLLGDYLQFKAHAKAYAKKYPSFPIKIAYVGESSDEVLLSILTNEINGIIICIANGTQMIRINDLISASSDLLRSGGTTEGSGSTTSGCRRLLFIDEIDYIAYKLKKEQTTLPSGKKSRYFQPEFDTLFDSSHLVFGVTATAFEVIFNEEKLDNHSVLYLKPPKNYKGISSFHIREMDDIKPPTAKGGASKDVASGGGKEKVLTLAERKEDQLVEVYTELSNVLPTSTTSVGGTFHPLICLNKTTNYISRHLEILDLFRTHETLSQHPWVIIIYNGNGITIYSSLLIGERIVIRDIVGKEDDLGRHFLPGACVQDALQWLKDRSSLATLKDRSSLATLKDRKKNSSKMLYTHILIISGNLACRGTNFVSRDFGWHLTHEYYIPSISADAADIIQSMRLCGIYKDTGKLTLITGKKASDNLKKAFSLHEEIFAKAYNIQERKKLCQIFTEISVHSDHVPKVKLSKKRMYKVREKTTTTCVVVDQIYYIKRGDLTPIMKLVYDTICKEITDSYDTDIWVDRGAILRNIAGRMKDPEKYYHLLRGRTGHFPTKFSDEGDDENKLGLLFKKVHSSRKNTSTSGEGSEWMLRYNY